jgi:hypothetical protein
MGSTLKGIMLESSSLGVTICILSHGVQSLEVPLDSQLVVCQLNGSYSVRDPTLLRQFVRVQLLEQYFDFLTYNHLPRSSNHVSNAYANYVLLEFVT